MVFGTMIGSDGGGFNSSRSISRMHEYGVVQMKHCTPVKRIHFLKTSTIGKGNKKTLRWKKKRRASGAFIVSFTANFSSPRHVCVNSSLQPDLVINADEDVWDFRTE